MPLPFHRRRLDPDAADFCRRSGATDRAAINAFVRGVKDLGLYNNMVCWPLRSTQNAGTGTTAYSLGGFATFDGTLMDGPTWGANGMMFNSNGIEANPAANFPASPMGYFVVFSPVGGNASTNLQVLSGNPGIGPAGRRVYFGYGPALGGPNGAAYALANSGSWDILTSNAFAGGSNFYALSYTQINDTTASIFKDGVNSIGYSGPATGWDSGSQGAAHRVIQGGFSANMQCAFVAQFRNTLGLNSSVYSLYKSTLGTGLGLP